VTWRQDLRPGDKFLLQVAGNLKKGEAKKEIGNINRQCSRLTARATALVTILECADIENDLIKEARKLAEDFKELFERMAAFDARFEKATKSPEEPHYKRKAALIALSLMKNLSVNKPTAGSCDSTFCRIGSLLFEAAQDPSLFRLSSSMEWACKRALREARG
jgi:hypothetical protein